MFVAFCLLSVSAAGILLLRLQGRTCNAYADMMGISRDTVMRLIHAGELEHVRIGRQYRIIV